MYKESDSSNGFDTSVRAIVLNMDYLYKTAHL